MNDLNLQIRTSLDLRHEARPAWRALVKVLIELDTLGIRTPCDHDPRSFVDEDVEIRRQAAKLCGGCPIRTQCGTFGEKQRTTAGVWGGKDRTRGAQAELARRRAASEHPGPGDDEHAFINGEGEEEDHRTVRSASPEHVPAGQRSDSQPDPGSRR